MAFCFLRCLQRSAQLGPALERIAALARLDLSELGQDLKALSLGERDDSPPLCREAQAALALRGRGDKVVGDQLGAHGDLGGRHWTPLAVQLASLLCSRYVQTA